MARLRALVLLTAVLIPTAARGQVGSTTDILTGVVIGMDDAPLAGAQVEATTIETQITRRQHREEQWKKLPERAEARARQPRTSLTFWARDSGLNGFCM